jgi:hypothetical protein
MRASDTVSTSHRLDGVEFGDTLRLPQQVSLTTTERERARKTFSIPARYCTALVASLRTSRWTVWPVPALYEGRLYRAVAAGLRSFPMTHTYQLLTTESKHDPNLVDFHTRLSS